MRILVVEDERGIAEFLDRALTAEGFAVTLASDGENGERLAVGGEFDLVLLDLRLPGRGGLGPGQEGPEVHARSRRREAPRDRRRTFRDERAGHHLLHDGRQPAHAQVAAVRGDRFP